MPIPHDALPDCVRVACRVISRIEKPFPPSCHAGYFVPLAHIAPPWLIVRAHAYDLKSMLPCSALSISLLMSAHVRRQAATSHNRPIDRMIHSHNPNADTRTPRCCAPLALRSIDSLRPASSCPSRLMSAPLPSPSCTLHATPPPTTPCLYLFRYALALVFVPFCTWGIFASCDTIAPHLVRCVRGRTPTS